jgi:hypothetical protein
MESGRLPPDCMEKMADARDPSATPRPERTSPVKFR